MKLSQGYRMSLAMRPHSVICHQTQMNTL